MSTIPSCLLSRKCRIGVIVFLFLLVAAGGYLTWQSAQPYRVGVLLPASGDDDSEYYETLEWAVDGLNREGVGRRIELVPIDTEEVPLMIAARQLIDDPSIRVVIGAATSDEAFRIAPDFIKAKKLLITPSATSGDLPRMFSRFGYIWRTTTGDRAQTRIIVNILKERGTRSAALLYEESTYGNTFRDWAAFYAIESDIELTSTVAFERGGELREAVSAACLLDPEYIIVAARGSDAAMVLRIMDEEGRSTRLIFTDAARTQAFLEAAGDLAEGAEGVSPTADRKTGFFVAYKEHFGRMPDDYAAHTYDSLILAVAALARMEAVPSESPALAMMAAVSGRDGSFGWDHQGTAAAIRQIRSGRLPDLTGASGPLEYHSDLPGEPLITWYVHWKVEEGDFRSNTYIPGSFGEKRTVQMLETMIGGENAFIQGEGGELHAVLVTTSSDWENYRHQADIAHMYSLLLENGVSPEDIIVISQEDIPYSTMNPIPGHLYHRVGGKNIYIPATVTDTPITSEAFVSFLLGKSSSEIPFGLESDSRSRLLLFMTGHGGPGFLDFPDDDHLTRSRFQETIQRMAEEERFSRMLIVVEACYGESMGIGLDIPGVVFMTGASYHEPSKGAEYDINLRQWLSNDFSMSMTDIIVQHPDQTLRGLYEMTYDRVSGSHPRIIAGNATDLNIPVAEFFCA
ncbi:ABC transporter substrate-binding protein [Methanocalculus taiwanensis]|uniref:ABC transporter substrate-binding protein n=1 Tax=Methanocalculus taiwanensis TaxID=106207 RepID=A0ABD4TJC3_9EURY|nr:C13 family peptidase [Methanocalculus taiwanensis]MCQ1537395.1 ABC transporter substrate-binding protein [Methanocalculus taiwanensis]